MCLEQDLAYSSKCYLLFVSCYCAYYLKHETQLWHHLLQEAFPDCPRLSQAVLWPSLVPFVTSFRAYVTQDRDFTRKDIL